MWKIGWLVLVGLLLYAPAEAAVRTTLHNAATAVANGTNMTVDNMGAAGVTVTGTFVGTLTFEGSADGAVTFSAVTCTNIVTLLPVTTTSTTGQYQCPIAGLSHFRARISAYTSGSITAIGTASAGSLGSAGGGGGVIAGSATASAPTLAEASMGYFSWDLAGNLRVTQGTLEAGEDLPNNLVMTSGGATRTTQILGTGGIPSTATDATSATSILPVGMKTFQGIVTCTGTCVQTQKIYGTYANAATVAASDLVCILTNNASTTATDWCKTDKNYSYWFVVTSATSGTTPLAGIFVMY